jgi:hypothetical protein
VTVSKARFFPPKTNAFPGAKAILAALMLAAAILVAPATRAQQVADDTARNEARTRFERGLTLYRDGAYDAALAEFLRSRELYPTRAATQNAGSALRRLGRFDEALDMFDRLLSEFPNLSEADRKAAEAERFELTLRVGTLEVHSAEAGATVVVDGKERGQTPTATTRVSAGSHAVRVYKEGFLPYETRVEVAGRQKIAVEARLGALTRAGRLAVTEDHGAKADVVIDDVAVGKTPWEGTLPVGPHTLALRGDGDLGSQPTPVEVRLGQVTRVVLYVEPLRCRLRVEPTPPSASIAVDAVEVGHGVWQGKLRCGAHSVDVSAPGFLIAHRAVPLAEGEPGIVRESLEQDPDSPMWKAKNPPRVLLEATLGALAGSSLGGDLNAGCTGACRAALSLGFVATVRAGYQLPLGLGFSVEAGYFSVRQGIAGRAAQVVPMGLMPDTGTANDALTLSGPVLGAIISYVRDVDLGASLVLGGALGASVLIGSATDARSGTFATGPIPPGVMYDTPLSTERTATRAIIVEPEVKVGYRIAKRWVVEAGLRVPVVLLLADIPWNDQTPVSAGVCPDQDTNRCMGFGVYGHQNVFGRSSVLVSPLVGVRAEL